MHKNAFSDSSKISNLRAQVYNEGDGGTLFASPASNNRKRKLFNQKTKKNTKKRRIVDQKAKQSHDYSSEQGNGENSEEEDSQQENGDSSQQENDLNDSGYENEEYLEEFLDISDSSDEEIVEREEFEREIAENAGE